MVENSVVQEPRHHLQLGIYFRLSCGKAFHVKRDGNNSSIFGQNLRQEPGEILHVFQLSYHLDAILWYSENGKRS